MDFVEGKPLDDGSTLSKVAHAQLKATLAKLHEQNQVYGDLRGPNIVVVVDENGVEHVMLLDFDWGGEEGVVLYPADINLEIDWHEEVAPGVQIRRTHDQFMLQHLGGTFM
jgi:tRNA A-37 threonylcarbamoyl transferase component Bud32